MKTLHQICCRHTVTKTQTFLFKIVKNSFIWLKITLCEKELQNHQNMVLEKNRLYLGHCNHIFLPRSISWKCRQRVSIKRLIEAPVKDQTSWIRFHITNEIHAFHQSYSNDFRVFKSTNRRICKNWNSRIGQSIVATQDWIKFNPH